MERRTLLAFGLTATTSLYTVDTGAGVTFSVLRGGTLTSTVHLGDLTSFKLNGVEFAAPFASSSRYSHVESGMSQSAVITATVDPNGNWIKITCDDSTATVGTGVAGRTGEIQYYMAKKNDPTIYMGTYSPEMIISSSRFITYLDWNKFPNHPNASDTSAIHGVSQTTIESGDVFADPVDGHTHSKYYDENRLIGHVYHGATGPTSGVFMFIGSRESGSGGPFWKDIDFQSTGSAVELYNIPYSDHSQTEPFRPGLNGPYALVLTNGSQPAITPDYTFIDGLGLMGWVSPSQRGSLTGQATGIAPGKVPTVALSNSVAQYWATPDASGNYTIGGIKPGTYTETLYQEELAVGTQTVTISAGSTQHANITSTYFLPNDAIWRIGVWDGTPREFLNGDKITSMHPSDPRMSAWAADASGLTNFIVGTTPDSAWPMAEWRYQNTDVVGPFMDTVNRITFDLTPEQAATALTVRIGITRLDHGRPAISVNGAGQTIFGLSTQPTARGLTLGSWRGNNTLYQWNISTSTLHAGTNTIDITCASGSGSGGNWLSPWHIYDALDLVPTATLSNAPVVTSITVAPGNPTLNLDQQQAFSATARDQFGQVTAANLMWSATAGIIDGVGLYTSPSTPGFFSVTATNGVVNGNASVHVIDTTPVVINGSSFTYQTAQVITFNFNKMSVHATQSGMDLVLENLTTGVPISPVNLTYSPYTGSFVYPGILPDGNYRATLPAGSVQDSFGNTFADPYSFNFFVLAGDANHDRRVDLYDLVSVATNWQTSGATFGQGDFDYNGVVNSADLAILAMHWQQNLDAPPPPLPPAATSVRRAPARTPTRVIDQVAGTPATPI